MDDDRRAELLCRWTALCGLALVAATWRLWTPQAAFPQVTFLAALRNAPRWLDAVGLAGLVGGLGGLLVVRGAAKATAAFVLSLGLLVSLDQHRFQPWAYQFAIVASVLALAPAERAGTLLRTLTVGLYVWSAVSKLDFAFLHGLGPTLLRGLLTAAQLDPDRLGENPASIAIVFPAGELIVAGLLAVRRTRPLGLAGAVLMHAALLLTLGPFGLNHEPGVLLWNLYFLGQDVLLFGGSRSASRRREPAGSVPKEPGSSHEGTRRLTPAARLATAIVVAAIALPALEPFGLFDHWPAWAVYAPGAERVTLWIDAAAADGLPEDVRRHLGPPDFLTDRRPLRADVWSLDALSAPLYPQGRFKAAVAVAVAERCRLGDAATLVVESRADRFTGRRTRTELVGAAAIGEYAASFSLNALPRRFPRR